MMRPLGVVLLLALPLAAMAASEDAAQAVIAGDYFGAGASAQPEEPIEGDAFIAGRTVSLRVPVDGDAVLSGARVSVLARVGADLYAAGGSVDVDAPVLRNARLAGGRVQLGRRAEIAGRATLAGNDVLVEGAVDGQLTVFAESVTLDGRFGSGIVVAARSLSVGPNARIHGRLTYRTSQPPVIDPGAEIIGGVKRSEAGIALPAAGRWARAAAWIGAAVFTGGILLLGALFILAAPEASAAAARSVRRRPLASLGLGLAVLMLLPLVALASLATVIGVPLGLALLLLWPVAMLLGYLGGVLFVGDSLATLFARSEDRAPAWLRIVCLGVVLAAILVSIKWPLFGWLLILLLTLAGAGALTLSRFGSRAA
jgi:cytoskeletal protein CcmA (bactofilin family)